MTRIASFVCALLLVAGSAVGVAAIDAYTFDTPAQEERFNELTNQLRCLVCQNQTIADSNADLARDLRAEVAGMIRAGQDNEQIIGFLVDRYGDFVLYKPPVKATTIALWVGPFVLILLGLAILLRFIRSRVAVTAPGEGELSAEERARLDALLDQPSREGNRG